MHNEAEFISLGYKNYISLETLDSEELSNS